ncbi:MAG: FecR family protein [Gallionella sp.]
MKNLSKALLGLTAMLVLLGGSGSVYAAIAGQVQYVHGKVQLTTAAGVTHAIKKGEAVNEGDTLLSSPLAYAQIRMADGGMVAMRPDTRLKIDRFTFDGQQDGTERSFISLFKGGFRAITGQIGKKNKANYRITTPATTIGIRGTDHETIVVTPGSSMAATTAIGTYNKVNMGETSMTTEKGTLFVLPNQMGFVGAADEMPHLQPINLKIFTATPGIESGRDRDEKSEGGREMRESTKMDREGMRDHATIGETGVHGTERMKAGEVEGVETSPATTDDAIKSLPKTEEH